MPRILRGALSHTKAENRFSLRFSANIWTLLSGAAYHSTRRSTISAYGMQFPSASYPTYQLSPSAVVRSSSRVALRAIVSRFPKLAMRFPACANCLIISMSQGVSSQRSFAFISSPPKSLCFIPLGNHSLPFMSPLYRYPDKVSNKKSKKSAIFCKTAWLLDKTHRCDERFKDVSGNRILVLHLRFGPNQRQLHIRHVHTQFIQIARINL